MPSDTERLDWLDKQVAELPTKQKPTWTARQRTTQFGFALHTSPNRSGYAKVRDAIDAEMELQAFNKKVNS